MSETLLPDCGHECGYHWACDLERLTPHYVRFEAAVGCQRHDTDEATGEMDRVMANARLLSPQMGDMVLTLRDGRGRMRRFMTTASLN